MPDDCPFAEKSPSVLDLITFVRKMVYGLSSVCQSSTALSFDLTRSAWLSILAAANKEKAGSGINDVLMMHWKKYGRSFFSR
jgi:hypothetical protein